MKYNVNLPLPEWWGSCLPLQINNKHCFIYYAQTDGSLYSRIRFRLKNFKDYKLKLPELHFTYEGISHITYDLNMTKNKYPEMYNEELINEIKNIVIKYKCLLLLIWFGLLDENDLLDYYLKRISLYDVIKDIDVKKKIKKDLLLSRTLDELDKKCIKHFLYQLKR